MRTEMRYDRLDSILYIYLLHVPASPLASAWHVAGDILNRGGQLPSAPPIVSNHDFFLKTI